MTIRNTNVFALWILLGVILGAILGIFAPKVMLSLGFVGMLFLNALTVLAIPLAIVAVISGVSALTEVKKIKRAVISQLMYYVVTALLAGIVCWVVFSIIKPSSNISLNGMVPPLEAMGAQDWSLAKQVSALLPYNLFYALSNGHYLGLIVLAIAIGAILYRIGSRGRTITTVCRELLDATQKLSQIILVIIPFGVVFLTGWVVAENNRSNQDIFYGAGSFITGIIVTTLIFGGVVLPLILKLWGKRPVLKYFWNSIPALSTAISTGSQISTLPISYDTVINKNHVDNRISSLVMPFGAVTGMAGVVLLTIASVLFTAAVTGVSISFVSLLAILAISTLLSFSAHNIPMGGLFLILICFRIADFPPSAYATLGLITTLTWVLDRFKAVINVWNDSICAVVVSHSINKPLVAPVRDQGRFDSKQGRFEQSKTQSQPWKTKYSKPVESGSPFSVNAVAESDLDVSSSKPALQEKTETKPEFNQTKRPERFDKQSTHQQRKQRGQGDHRRDDRGRNRDNSQRRFGDRQRNDRGYRSNPDHHQRKSYHRENQRSNEVVPQEEIISSEKQEQFVPTQVEAFETTGSEIKVDSYVPDQINSHPVHNHVEKAEGLESPSSDNNDEKPVTFGRTRNLRIEKNISEGDQEPSENIEEKQADGTVSSEPIQFGRSRRKRPL